MLLFISFYFVLFIIESNSGQTLLITPESMLLTRGGSIHILAGIPRSSSAFSAPDHCLSGACEKVILVQIAKHQ